MKVKTPTKTATPCAPVLSVDVNCCAGSVLCAAIAIRESINCSSRWLGEGETVKEKQTASQVEFIAALDTVLNDVRQMLIEKNAAYGNSALEPVRIFSSASTVEQILVRIDDKLSRLQRGHEFQGEDTARDLLGYLILLEIAKLEGEVSA
jgi:hypothetical protein